MTSPLAISAVLESPEHRLFRIEDVCRTGEPQSFFARDLGDGAFGSQVAPEDLDVAGRLQWDSKSV